MTSQVLSLIPNKHFLNTAKLLNIVKLGNAALKQKCKPLTFSKNGQLDPFDRTYIYSMLKTLNQAGGVGLAAPQVDYLKRVFIGVNPKTFKNDENFHYHVYINPKILNFSDEKTIDFEGCLSIPKFYVILKRSKEIEVEYQTLEGEKVKTVIGGLPARIFQHEYDHLEGVTTFDRIETIREQVVSEEELDLYIDETTFSIKPEIVNKMQKILK